MSAGEDAVGNVWGVECVVCGVWCVARMCSTEAGCMRQALPGEDGPGISGISGISGSEEKRREAKRREEKWGGVEWSGVE